MNTFPPWKYYRIECWLHCEFDWCLYLIQNINISVFSFLRCTFKIFKQLKMTKTMFTNMIQNTFHCILTFLSRLKKSAWFSSQFIDSTLVHTSVSIPIRILEIILNFMHQRDNIRTVMLLTCFGRTSHMIWSKPTTKKEFSLWISSFSTICPAKLVCMCKHLKKRLYIKRSITISLY